jgi:hypothetical protein
MRKSRSAPVRLSSFPLSAGHSKATLTDRGSVFAILRELLFPEKIDEALPTRRPTYCSKCGQLVMPSVNPGRDNEEEKGRRST